MKSSEEIKEIIAYLQSKEDKPLQYNEEAIAAAYQRGTAHQSLMIKILSVLGGLLASIAFIGFLFLAGLYDAPYGMFFLGIVCIVIAIWLSKQFDQVLLDTVSVSFFVIGFVLLGFGFMELDLSSNVTCISFILLATVALFIVRTYLLVFLAVLVINGSILALILSNNIYYLLHLYAAALAVATTFFFLKEAMLITAGKPFSLLYKPIRTGLVCSFFSGLFLLGKRDLINLSPHYHWIPSLVIITAIVYLVRIVLPILQVLDVRHMVLGCAATVLVLSPTMMAPAITGALLVILLSFLVQYTTGLVLGIMALVYFMAQFYYDLSVTLLTKSILLMASGVLFLVLYLFTRKKLSSIEKV
jgi:hypothetical protein